MDRPVSSSKKISVSNLKNETSESEESNEESFLPTQQETDA